MELRRQTWARAFRVAVIVSVVAAVAAVMAAAIDVPQVAIVLTVIIVAFGVSWVSTGRVMQQSQPDIVGPN
ncbi:MAG: hypothetical protein AAGF73_04170 [Actinomycetota bacterium]